MLKSQLCQYFWDGESNRYDKNVCKICFCLPSFVSASSNPFKRDGDQTATAPLVEPQRRRIKSVTSTEQAMKRGVPWSDGDDDSDDGGSSNGESSSSDRSGSSPKASATNSKGSSKLKTAEAASAKRRSKGVDLTALSRYGYKGGLSVLNVPPPKEQTDDKKDWSWSKGQETRVKESEETYEERQRTRAALVEGEQLANARTQKEKNLSYSQREKKKRDLGQASRGKNYVEEEKRLLRESGVYSGFDL